MTQTHTVTGGATFASGIGASSFRDFQGGTALRHGSIRDFISEHTELGEIPFDALGATDLELAVMHHPRLERLKNIRQLGTSYSGLHNHPGADRSRYSHCCGEVYPLVCVASKVLDLDSHTRLLLCLAALLHDVGHGPCSHGIENSRHAKIRRWDHEVTGANLVQTEFRELIDNHPDAKKLGVTAELVANLLRQDGKHYNLGMLLKDLDRCGYLWVDVPATGAAPDRTFSTRRAILNFIDMLDIDKTGSWSIALPATFPVPEDRLPHIPYVVETLREHVPMFTICEARHWLFETTNCSRTAALVNAAFGVYVDHLVKKGVDFDQIIPMTDQQFFDLSESETPFRKWFDPHPETGRVEIDRHMKIVSEIAMADIAPQWQQAEMFDAESANVERFSIREYLQAAYANAGFQPEETLIGMPRSYSKKISTPVTGSTHPLRLPEIPIDQTKNRLFVAVPNGLNEEKWSCIQQIFNEIIEKYLGNNHRSPN